MEILGLYPQPLGHQFTWMGRHSGVCVGKSRKQYQLRPAFFCVLALCSCEF